VTRDLGFSWPSTFFMLKKKMFSPQHGTSNQSSKGSKINSIEINFLNNFNLYLLNPTKSLNVWLIG